MKPSLLIMAAGIGSRYGTLKQIDSIGTSGESIMEYSAYDAVRAGFGKVIFVIRKSFEEKFIEQVINRLQKKINVDYVLQELDMLPEGFTCPAYRQKPWGASQAVLAAQEKINEPFAAINADDYYGQNSYKIMNDYLSTLENNSTSYAMIGYRLQNTLSEYGTVTRGICRAAENGNLQEVTEVMKVGRLNDNIVYYDENNKAVLIEASRLASMNFWGFTPVVFEQIHQHFKKFLIEHGHELKSEYPLPTVVDDILKSGRATVKVLPCNDQWFGVTYKEDKPIVIQKIKNLIATGLYPENLWK